MIKPESLTESQVKWSEMRLLYEVKKYDGPDVQNNIMVSHDFPEVALQRLQINRNCFPHTKSRLH